ncbi:MAG: hybrid sensor histidine kinase/response regulator [Candidatus Thermoplasmatota archaeon]|nr:hybrid sensor histidine kinase/response regulator [Candidatus Thermoplasmatota archaeon]
MTILLIEDDTDSLELLELIMKDSGFDTIGVNSGQKGLDRIRSKPEIQMILLDLMMPDMDGFEVLEIMKKEGYLDTIPVIVVSALNDPGSITRAFDMGAFEYVTKPFDGLSLTARVKSSLKFYNINLDLREKNKSLVQMMKESDAKRKTLESNVEYLEDLIDILDHKVKNAIVPIMNYSEIFSKEASDERDRRIFRNILDSVNDLNMTIEDLIFGLKERSTSRHNKIEEVELSPLVKNIELFFLNGFKKKNIDFKVVLDPGLPVSIRTDLTILIEIIDNLVSNSIKYSGEGGKISLEIENVDNGISIIVEDEGMGIPSEELERIFDRNYIVDPHKKIEGMNRTGVGLFLVKKFTNSLHGSVKVESEVGKGSRFTVTLPNQKEDEIKMEAGSEQHP